MSRNAVYLFVVAILLVLGASGGAFAQEAGLVAWWTLDEGSGTTAADSADGDNEGTLSAAGATWSTQGQYGGAMEFSTANAYVRFPTDGMSADSGTVALWANLAADQSVDTRYLWGHTSSEGGYADRIQIYMDASTTDLDVGLGGAHALSTNIVNLDTGTWYHIALTWDNGAYAVYLDGEEIAAGSYSGLATLKDYAEFGNNGSGNEDQGFFGRIDEVIIYDRALSLDEVVSVMNNGLGAKAIATQPDPEDGAVDVHRDAVLSWMAGKFPGTHDVYFGTSEDDVAAAERSNPLGVLVSQGQDVTEYDPEGLLDIGQTYYWRIDEVNATPDGFIHTGDVWSFTAEPFTYPVENLTVSASTTSQPGAEPNNVINGSGLNAGGGHSIVEADMWVGQAIEGEPAWIQFDFDRRYKLQSVHIWNYNMQYESFLGLGVKDVTIEYTDDPGQWLAVGDLEVSQGPGLATYAGTTIDLGGIAARSIRINIHNNRSFMQPLNYGLSEVRFNYIPVHAREPEPADGATDVSIDATLAWRPGREAVTHQVNLGTDPNALELADTVTTDTYDPGTLALASTYYWQIDEVNEAATPSVWASNRWSFTTQDYITVDDFESYTDDDGSLVYESWADGFGVASNGSQVGHDNPPYAEQTFVHSGRQAMPFHYGKEGATTSEATLTLAGEDWTRGEAQTLVLYVRGNLENPAGQLYLKVNNTRVDFPGSTASLAGALWQQWNVELASLGNAARNVTSLTLGVSSSGEGLLFIDDIRLYRSAEPMPGPAADPGSVSLAAHYTMTDNVADSSGNGYGGTAEVGSSFGQGPAGYGRALVLDGVSGYATLPIGSLIQSLDSITVSTWVNYLGSGAWQRLFDFGTDTDVYMFLTPSSGTGTLRFAITTGSTDGEAIVEGASALPDGWRHVAVTIDGATGEMVLYLDGLAVGSATTTTLPSDLGETTQNWIGRSQYTADAYFNGSVDDFRIYNRTLSEAEIRYLVGAR